MKVLFLYPNITRERSPQLGICMLAAVARRLGHECDLYDVTTIPEGGEVQAFRAKTEEFDPDLLAVSCLSSEWAFLQYLFDSVDMSGKLKIFGGPHATVSPEQVLEIADVAVLGEGEETFAELLEKIESSEDFAGTAGTWVKKDGRIVKNAVRRLIPDLDQLPMPYWRIFQDVHFSDSFVKPHFRGARVIGVFERSRGCPYACTYCTNHYVRGLYKGAGTWRREKSPERVIEEMRLFRDDFALDAVYLIDEVVLTRKGALEKFRDLYRSEIGKPFTFMERPENMTDEKVRLIKEAGAERVSIGIESGDEGLRRNLLNRKMSQDAIVAAFETARRHGLITHAFTMIGFPGEDRNSILETYKLLKKARPDALQTSIFHPLIGTKLYSQTVEEGLFDPDTPMPTSYYQGSSLNFSEEWKKELLRWRYILTNYQSRLNGLWVLKLPEPAFQVLVAARKVYNELRNKGLVATVRKIVKHF
jgi:radical SAM superfamily enzyme YgiQ (UPF0313 family)